MSSNLTSNNIPVGIGYDANGDPKGFVELSSIETTNRSVGFMDYNNTVAPFTISANVWTDIPNDGLGAFTNKTYAPTPGGSSIELINTASGTIEGSGLTLGDAIIIRNDIRITPNVNFAVVEFRYQLGSGLGTYYLTKLLGTLSNGAGIEYSQQFEDYIYMGDENTRLNPIRLQIKCSEDATFQSLGSVIQVLSRNT